MGTSATLATGVDVGGTFTDAAAIAPDGRITTAKVLSTPGDQGEGVVAALLALGSPSSAVRRVVHGTTVVTNLLLERTGARVVLCATQGATDLLELRRQDRASLYDLAAHHPAPLVAPGDVVEVRERRRVRGKGSGDSGAPGESGAPGATAVALALTGDEIARVAAAVLALAPDVVVISLLHAYDDDAHERRLADALRAASPGLAVVTAAAVLPELREYERTATAAAEGYARPRVERYLERLSARLATHGFPAPSVMTSGGGMRRAESAACHAASLALSGPAGGVVGAAAVLRASGRAQALTIDIGGTSADAGLILDGEPLVEPGGVIAGVPIALPRVLVETVSAGGGSLAWVDEGGALRVGPRSAGVVPGPVAFGRGGTEPTVTDAQVALGRIGSASMSGGVSLEVAGARASIGRLARSLGVEAMQVAQAIVDAADAEMARALRRVSVDRGVDPRECTLVAFGGGGPLHACALATALDMPAVLVPPHAGVLSAVGLALAPEQHEAAMSLLRPAAALDADSLSAHCEHLAAMISGSERQFIARVRYVGQGHELDVRLHGGDDGPAVAARFAEVHRSRYGFTLDRDAEFVALRHVAGEAAEAVRFARDRSRPAWDAVRRVDCGGPAPTNAVAGPVSIVLDDATLWVAAGWTATALEIGGWMLERA